MTEAGAYTEGSVKASAESYAFNTFGRLFGISRNLFRLPRRREKRRPVSATIPPDGASGRRRPSSIARSCRGIAGNWHVDAVNQKWTPRPG